MKPIKKAKKIIEDSEKIFIFPTENKKESIPVALALFHILKEMKKEVNLVLGEIPKDFHFLTPSPGSVSSPKNFVISIPDKEGKISEVRYKRTNRALNLHLKTKGGVIKKNKILFNLSQPQPDLLITLGVDNKNNIKLPEFEPESLSELSILNINNKNSEKFGEVNLVKTNCSLSKIITDFIGGFKSNLFTEDIANCLLSGIIVYSDNFKNSKNSPGSLESASFLIEKGASHQKVIHNLYKSKPLPQIKFLGNILQNLQFNQKTKTFWSILASNKFPELKPKIAPTIKELSSNLLNFKNLLLLSEGHASPPRTRGVFYSKKSAFLKKLKKAYQGTEKRNQIYFSTKEPNANLVKNKVLKLLST